MKAALYARVSTQAQSQEGDSLEAQDAAMRAWCQARGYEVAASWVEVDSGGKWGRVQLQELLRAAEAPATKPWDALVVWRVDRLARSPRDLEEVVGRLKDRGIAFHSVNEPDLSGAQGDLFRPVIAFAAAWERRAIGQRVKASIIQRQEAGTYLSPRPPHGYAYLTKAEGGPAWVVQEPEADQVRWAFQAYLEAGSARQVAQAMNAKGWTTRGGAPWWPGDVLRMLDQPAYRGTLRLGVRELVQQGRRRRNVPAPPERLRTFPGAVPVIVDPDTWAAAQAVREGRRGQAPQRVAAMGSHPWVGLVTCSCGSSMILDSRAAGGRAPRLVCRAGKLGGTCPGGSFAQHHLTGLVLPLVRSLVEQAQWGSPPSSAKPSGKGAPRERERKSAQARLERAWAAYERGIVDLARFERTKREIDAQLEALASEAAGPRQVPALDGDFATWWSAATTPLRGQLLQDLGVSVTWTRERLVVELAPLAGLDAGPHELPLPRRAIPYSKALAALPAWTL